MLKKIHFFFILISIITPILLHAQFQCGTDAIHKQLLADNPNYIKQIKANEAEYLKAVDNDDRGVLGTCSGSNILTFPIVVHVIHLGEQEGTGSNVSNTVINAAIAKLNSDFRNSTNNPNSTDTEIQFALARRDPNGNSTSGIVRVSGANVPNYATNGINHLGNVGAGAIQNDIKKLSIWPIDKYYNIWIVNKITGTVASGAGIAGFANYPGDDLIYDGTVLVFDEIGVTSITLSHELGHGFNLKHTFDGDNGDTNCPLDNNCTTEGDNICDTAPHKTADCTATSCTGTTANTQNWDNSRFNYMSYCFTNFPRFTNGQKIRLRAAGLGSIRGKLLESDALIPVGKFVEAGIKPALAQNSFSTTFSYQVSLKNYGTSAITSATIICKIDGQIASTTNFTGNIATNNAATITLNTVTTTTGQHSLEVSWTSINGALNDNYAYDNAFCTTFYAASPQTTFPYCNTFDNAQLPTDWIVSGNAPVEFSTQNICTVRGANIIKFNTFGNTINEGFNSKILLKPVDLSSNANFSNLTFSIAAKKTFYCDAWKGLKIEVSKDLGQTWNSVYNKTDAYTITTDCGGAGQCPCTTASAEELASVSKTIAPTTAFLPKSCQEWRDEKVDLTPFIGNKVLIRFVMYSNISLGIDNIYLDDICINKITCGSATANITGSTTFCEGANTVLTALSGANYKWSNGLTKDNITITKAGIYSVTVTNLNGCTAVGTKTVATIPSPKIEIKGDSSFCVGSNTTISANGGNQYIWSNGEKTPSISINTGGTYTVTATNSNGCTASLSKTIISKSKPNATLGGTKKICEGDSTKLNTLNSNGNTYLWSNGEKKSSIIVKTTGNYGVTITNALGCTASNSIPITVNSIPNITIIRNGNQLTATGGDSYVWSSGEKINLITCSKSDTYTVTTTDSQGCTAVKSINIALLSSEENQENIAFQVFPNPNNGTFQIVKNSNLEGIEAHIYNVAGQLIQKEILTKNTTNININTTNKGVFYLYLIEKDKNIYQQKIIVE